MYIIFLFLSKSRFRSKKARKNLVGVYFMPKFANEINAVWQLKLINDTN